MLSKDNIICRRSLMAFVGLRLSAAAQRFALAAGGRDEIRFESRKNPKPEKSL
jgi:hypothetical protein